ncbi:MAG: ATP-binding cassette domain-containing protein [Actinomycetota bacterium]|nr:ATP-binding cassette domain-containing protein [Actinomycetota bacterium]
MSATPALELAGVHKSFAHSPVLRGIDLAVAPHEVVCLIGASGSGKSTLLRCANLLEPIDAGKILLEGHDLTAEGIDPNLVRREVGIVFQSYNLFPHMTVLRNITLAPTVVLGHSRVEAESEARALLARFGLADKKRRATRAPSASCAASSSRGATPDHGARRSLTQASPTRRQRTRSWKRCGRSSHSSTSTGRRR